MLWIFGDSYSADFINVKHHADWIYYQYVASCLSLDVKNFSIGGSSLGYTYYQFDTNYDSMCVGDYVLITLTDLERKFFFLDRPQVSTYQCFSAILYNVDASAVHVSKYEQQAYEGYLKHLDKNPIINTINLRNFLYMLDTLAVRKDLKILILPGFKDSHNVSYSMYSSNQFERIIVADNYLSNISMYECVDRISYDLINYTDYRKNHMLKSNHKILADKIIKSFESGESFDLLDGSIKSYITEDVANNKFDLEFFDYYVDQYI